MSKVGFIKHSTMKSIVYASILVLFLLGFLAPQLASAQTSGSSADGSFRFSTEDGLTKSIEFSAITNRDGSTTGKLTFNDSAEIPDLDVDGTRREGSNGSVSGLYVEAAFDCLVIERNRAVMSGVVTSSNIGDNIGQRVLLVVEDNGNGSEDKVAWGIYKPAEKWERSDAELKEDPGALLTWMASDAERRDDAEVLYPKDESIGCQSSPLSSYSFDDVRYWGGDIQVKQ